MVKLIINSKTIEDIDLVIFDKDGTLIELYPYWSGIANYRLDNIQSMLEFDDAYKKHLETVMGVDSERKELNENGPIGLLGRDITLAAIVNVLNENGYDDAFEVCNQAFKDADILSTKNYQKLIIPINGMFKLIDSLYKKKCLVAVATNDSRERADLVFDYLKIRNKIDIVIGIDMVKHGKPAPDMINLILKELQIDKRNTVMIGDSILDIEMGINASVTPIAIGNNSTEENQLGEYRINDFSEVRVL